MSEANRGAFTATQWQELEQQATIFKYMVLGVQIPPDLISSVKTSLGLSSRLFPHQPIIQLYGRKEDPEPGRCRRTDGKKWRCSKEAAHPHSKYCERHMHRGKHRSRKPVEVISSSSSTNPNSTTCSAAAAAAAASSYSVPHLSAAESYSFLHPHSSSSFPSPQNSTTHQLFSDSGSYSETNSGYGYSIHGARNEEDEIAFFPEASRTSRTPNDPFTPLTMRSTGYSQYQNFESHHQQQQVKQHFALGADFTSDRPIKDEREEEMHKPFHHFFGEWAPKRSDYS